MPRQGPWSVHRAESVYCVHSCHECPPAALTPTCSTCLLHSSQIYNHSSWPPNAHPHWHAFQCPPAVGGNLLGCDPLHAHAREVQTLDPESNPQPAARSPPAPPAPRRGRQQAVQGAHEGVDLVERDGHRAGEAEVVAVLHVAGGGRAAQGALRAHGVHHWGQSVHPGLHLPGGRRLRCNRKYIIHMYG
jgi:hypothetical protein